MENQPKLGRAWLPPLRKVVDPVEDPPDEEEVGDEFDDGIADESPSEQGGSGDDGDTPSSVMKDLIDKMKDDLMECPSEDDIKEEEEEKDETQSDTEEPSEEDDNSSEDDSAEEETDSGDGEEDIEDTEDPDDSGDLFGDKPDDVSTAGNGGDASQEESPGNDAGDNPPIDDPEPQTPEKEESADGEETGEDSETEGGEEDVAGEEVKESEEVDEEECLEESEEEGIELAELDEEAKQEAYEDLAPIKEAEDKIPEKEKREESSKQLAEITKKRIAIAPKKGEDPKEFTKVPVGSGYERWENYEPSIHSHAANSDSFEEELLEALMSLSDDNTSWDKNPRKAFDLEEAVKNKKLENVFSVIVSKIAEDLSGYPIPGDDEWDIERLIMRKHTKKPLTSYRQSRERERLVLLLDTSGSCSSMSNFYSLLSVAAQKYGDIEVFEAPNAEIIIKNTRDKYEQMDFWPFKNRTIIFFGDWDGLGIVTREARNNKVYWFSCETRMDSTKSHRYYGDDGYDIPDFLRIKTSRYYKCVTADDFVKLLRKVR